MEDKRLAGSEQVLEVTRIRAWTGCDGICGGAHAPELSDEAMPSAGLASRGECALGNGEIVRTRSMGGSTSAIRGERSEGVREV